MNKGRFTVISAPSGAGKTTICRRLQEAHPDWRFSVSATTRRRRAHETNGADYTFLSDEQFDAYVDGDKFIEWEWVHGHRYGTLHTTLQSARDAGHALLLDVDVKGGVNIKREYPEDTIAIFVVPPNLDVLQQRLRGRGTEEEAVIQTRLARVQEELSYQDEFDHVVVNDDLDQAVREIETIIMGDS